MISSIGGSGDTLNRVEEYLQERRDKAAGKARVAASSVDIKDVELKEAEQNALAEQALPEFESAYGFATPPPAQLPPKPRAAPPVQGTGSARTASNVATE